MNSLEFILADVELDKINTQLAELLRGLELRKRAYYVNMPNIVYIIGMKFSFKDLNRCLNRRIFIRSNSKRTSSTIK